MLNRRHLRIKVLQGLYAYYQDEGNDMLSIEKGMWKSIDRFFDLYIRLLIIFPELKHRAELRIEEAHKKVLPSEEDLNPNLKFINNAMVQLISSNLYIREISESRKINWQNEEGQEIIKKLYNQIRNSAKYKEYMISNELTFEEDKEFVISIFKDEIANFDLLHNYIEEQSIFWNDDLDLVCVAVIKTIKKFESDLGVKNPIMTLHKDEEDEQEFVRLLYRKTIQEDVDSTQLIDQLTKNWEVERIAKMDIILMKMAITELMYFPEIPKKVSLNEYIDISKYYSTPKSNTFINGVLDKAVEILEKEGKINKKGRGLLQ